MTAGHNTLQGYGHQRYDNLEIARAYMDTIHTLSGRCSAISSWMQRNREPWAWMNNDPRPEMMHPMQARSDHDARRGGNPYQHSHHDQNSIDDDDSQNEDGSRSGEYEEESRLRVVIMDCGVAEINGTYKKSGLYDCVPKFVCTSRYNGRDEEFSIFRCRLTDNTRRWYISIVPMTTHPGTTQDIDFYASLPDMDGFPPSEGWVTIGPTSQPTAGRGVDPPPRVLPVHLYPDNIKTLEQFAVFETCDAETVFMYDNRITFQFSISEIESDMKCRIDQIVRVMKRHPNVKVHLDTHSGEALVAYERGLSVCYSISKRLDDDQAEEEGDEDDGQTPINERIYLSSWGKKIMNQLSSDHPFQNDASQGRLGWVEVYFVVKDDRKVEEMYLPKRHLYYLGHEPDLSLYSESESSESESSESD